MLRFLTRLAAKLPTVAVMTRFAPLVALAAGCISAAVALYQFQSQVAINRISATFALNAQYWSEIRNGSITIKEGDQLEDINEAITERTICQFQVRAASALADHLKGANCSNARSASSVARQFLLPVGQRLPDELVEEIREAQIEALNLDAIVSFLASVVVCVEVKGCNARAAYQLFNVEMTTFVCMLGDSGNYSPAMKAASLKISDFLRNAQDGQSWPILIWTWFNVDLQDQPLAFCQAWNTKLADRLLPAAETYPKSHRI